MAFKKLTGLGENFITTICSSGGNSLLSGSKPYKLVFSNDPEGTIYTATPKDRNGKNITTNSQLGVELIYWFNTYSELFELDANIIAAQAYIESNYVLWTFPDYKYTTSAQGISQLKSSALYDIIISNKGYSSNSSELFTSDEINRITDGLIDPRLETSYSYVDNGGGNETAISNRVKFFNNCISNPDLMIKAQCRLMKGLSFIAADNAASCLFGYNQGGAYIRETFTATLKNAEPNTLSLSRYNDGVKYVNKIFSVLGNKTSADYKPTGLWFGYNIDFTFDEFKIDVATSGGGTDFNNISKSTPLSPNYVLGDLITTSTGLNNLPDTKEEFDKLKIFANVILEPLNKRFNTRFIVNSSYRNNAVNAKVGGVVSSQHKLAEAADIRVITDNPNLLFQIYETIIAEKTVDFDQIIYETKGDSIAQRWIHISYKSKNTKKNRKQTLLADNKSGSMKYTPYVA